MKKSEKKVLSQIVMKLQVVKVCLLVKVPYSSAKLLANISTF